MGYRSGTLVENGLLLHNSMGNLSPVNSTVLIYPFLNYVLPIYSLKNPSDVCRGYSNRTLVENELIYKIGAGYRIVLPVRWQIIYESLIFYEITAKYEKQIKYLSILLQATCDNYIIITQKYARDEI